MMKHGLYMAVAVITMLMSQSCAEWTTPETIGVRTESLKDSNPELYAEYCGMLRAYKASDHKVVYTVFNNVETPRNWSHHPASLPDSVDFVEFAVPDMADWVEEEIALLKADKGMKFILKISLDAFKDEWNALQTGFAGNLDEYVVKREHELLSKVKEYGYDGICVSYTGKYTDQMYENEKAAYIAEQENFLNPVKDWVEANPDKMFFFEVKPQFILDAGLLKSADFIILPTKDETSAASLSFVALEALRDEVTATLGCRFLYSVSTVSYDETDVVTGLFSTGDQISVASRWMMSDDAMDKSGLVIYSAERDYYNSNPCYALVRKAIKTMNPNS